MTWTCSLSPSLGAGKVLEDTTQATGASLGRVCWVCRNTSPDLLRMWLQVHLSKAVSCSKRKREVDPQCCCVDVRLSSPTREDTASRSDSWNLEGVEASSSMPPEKVWPAALWVQSSISCWASLGTV